MPPAQRKVVVTGPFGAGKTTFTRTLFTHVPSTGRLLCTETGVSDGTRTLKASTTVALDHATVDVAPPPGATFAAGTVALFGTPGQDRFRFMWELLARDMDAYVVLVDASRPTSVEQARGIVETFAGIAPHVPRLIGVSRWADPAGTRDALAAALGAPAHSLAGCDPRDAGDCLAVLHALLEGAARTAAQPGGSAR